MKIYRTHCSSRAAGDYKGATVAGGRRSPIGTPTLYTAQHLLLACIEVLVHLDKSQLPQDYVWSKADLAADPQLLAFKSLSGIVSCQAAGDAWVSGVSQLAVQVPPVLIPEEFNILLNPRHAEYNGLVWSDPRPFRFDPRLFVAEPQTLWTWISMCRFLKTRPPRLQANLSVYG